MTRAESWKTKGQCCCRSRKLVVVGVRLETKAAVEEEEDE
jgi:hypothetical protein